MVAGLIRAASVVRNTEPNMLDLLCMWLCEGAYCMYKHRCVKELVLNDPNVFNSFSLKKQILYRQQYSRLC